MIWCCVGFWLRQRLLKAAVWHGAAGPARPGRPGECCPGVGAASAGACCRQQQVRHPPPPPIRCAYQFAKRLLNSI